MDDIQIPAKEFNAQLTLSPGKRYCHGFDPVCINEIFAEEHKNDKKPTFKTCLTNAYINEKIEESKAAYDILKLQKPKYQKYEITVHVKKNI